MILSAKEHRTRKSSHHTGGDLEVVPHRPAALRRVAVRYCDLINICIAKGAEVGTVIIFRNREGGATI